MTRRELYPILGQIFLLISVALIGVARQDQNTMMLISDYIFFSVAIALCFTFNIWGINLMLREKRARKAEGRGLTESADPAERSRE
jgi:hypothetical protein